MRAIDSIPRGEVQAAQALGLHGRQVFRYVVLPQAIANVFPALLSQVLIVMLGSAVVSRRSRCPILTYATQYLPVFSMYLVLSIVLQQLHGRSGRNLFAGRAGVAAAATARRVTGAPA